MSEEPLSHLYVDTHEVRRHLLGLHSGYPLFPAVVHQHNHEGVTDAEEDGPKEQPVSPQVSIPFIGCPRFKEREPDGHGPNLPNSQLWPVRDDEPLCYLVTPEYLLVPTDDLLEEVEGAVILARKEHVL